VQKICLDKKTGKVILVKKEEGRGKRKPLLGSGNPEEEKLLKSGSVGRLWASLNFTVVGAGFYSGGAPVVLNHG